MSDKSKKEDRHSAEAAVSMDTAVRRALVESRSDLVKVLRRRLRNPDEADEVLQRFVLKALEHSNDLRDVRSVRGWLARILATTIIDHQRATTRRRKREHAVDPIDLENMADRLIDADPEIDEAICQCLYKLLPTLKAEYSELIWRVDLLDEPRDRLAISLGLTVNNLTVRLHRARQALKLRLEQMCQTCAVHGFLNCECDDAQRQRQNHAPS